MSFPAQDEMTALMDAVSGAKRPSAGKIKAIKDLCLKHHKVC